MTEHAIRNSTILDVQVWDRGRSGGWITISAPGKYCEEDALAVAARVAAHDPDVRVVKDGESIARWLMGQRTIP